MPKNNEPTNAAPAAATPDNYVGNVRDATRTLDTIVKEIKDCRNRIERDEIKIGYLLIEAKTDPSLAKTKEWRNWLKENFAFSDRTASRLMRIADKFNGSPALANLGLSRTKADVLLRLADDEREKFMEEHNIENFSTRQLEEKVREHLGNQSMNPKNTKGKSATWSYGCPKCELTIWAEQEVNVICGDCSEKLTETKQSPA
jgi:ssDNA-binding Zn-finger/Zn-ribbon topoisomerase 1